ncbi:conserved hypothetical protein [uncultured Desulfatiglans sp.]|uniref:General secretion pathway protein M n=1 Tax=Uncultured Desulfatiglans sp. TaxID=1748965 RepID=A0A653A1V9_UNCDX|nr:conserved hypothetical protein [uncultured Desulfatiglans sp.]
MQIEWNKRTRIIVLCGLVALLGGVLFRFYPALSGMFDRSDEIASRELTLRKYRKVVESGEDVNVRIDSLRKMLGRMEAGLLKGTTPSLAAADIQSILNGIADRSKVQTKTVRVLKAEPVEGLPYMSVPVEFTVNCGIRQLKEILYQIENSPKYLTVQKVRINVVRRGRVDQIQGDVTVVGLMRKS